jgi:glycine dehydrogenase subunit 2
MMTNPEDTGLFNPRIHEYTDAVHAAGGVCAIDQANANGILGITRAKELGFDLCHFNLHKTFSSPHGSEGPACGAVGVKEAFRDFLPVPIVEFDGQRYSLNATLPNTIGKVRGFMGNLGVVVRAYAWAMSMGAEGLRTVAETAVINNNYLAKRLSEIPGLDIPYAEGVYRLQEVRYSWQKLLEETGVGTLDVARRANDYGVNTFFSSHEPWIIPEPFTPEPAESYSKADLDEYAEIMARVAQEAYENPELVKSAPHRSSITRVDETALHDDDKVVTTWRAWQKRNA